MKSELKINAKIIKRKMNLGFHGELVFDETFEDFVNRVNVEASKLVENNSLDIQYPNEGLSVITYMKNGGL